MALARWPEGLPMPLMANQRTKHVSPLLTSTLTTGRTRQRRRFKSVPSRKSVQFLMNAAQAQLFEAWFAADHDEADPQRGGITDGADWFLCRLRTPLGIRDYECKFVGMYEGPNENGFLLCGFSATLELKERPILPPGYVEFPEFVLGSSIIDIALNDKAPLA